MTNASLDACRARPANVVGWGLASGICLGSRVALDAWRGKSHTISAVIPTHAIAIVQPGLVILSIVSSPLLACACTCVNEWYAMERSREVSASESLTDREVDVDEDRSEDGAERVAQ